MLPTGQDPARLRFHPIVHSCWHFSRDPMSTGLFGNDVTLSEDIDDDLYWACHSGSDEDRLYDLIRKGANVNACVGKQKNMTCLSAAVSGGHVHTVRALLRRGADVDIRAKGGTNSPTPLHIACRHGMFEMVQVLLLEFNADMDAVDGDNNTPADLAGKIHHSGIIKILNEQKMNLMMSTPSMNAAAASKPAPRKGSDHRRMSSTLTDGGKAAAELDGDLSSFTPPAVDGAATKGEGGEGRHDALAHGRSTSTDLEMLLVAHRQLTVRESSRDRQLQRIQDSVTNLQAGMHRMVYVYGGTVVVVAVVVAVVVVVVVGVGGCVLCISPLISHQRALFSLCCFYFLRSTMVDGLRLLVVESLQVGEKETVQRIEKSTKQSLTQLKTATEKFQQEKTKTVGLEAKCQKLQKEMSAAKRLREELEINLKMAREHLNSAIDDKANMKANMTTMQHTREKEHKEAKERIQKKEKQEKQEKQIKRDKEKKEAEKTENTERRDKREQEKRTRVAVAAPPKIGTEAQKRLERLALEKRTATLATLVVDEEVSSIFGTTKNIDGLFGSDDDDDDNENGTTTTSPIHRERRPSATLHHKEPNVRRLSRSDASTLMTTMIVDDFETTNDGAFDDPDDLFGIQKKSTTATTNLDDLFDFA